MEKKYYQIEEVARITGLTKRAIRYYEDIRLITPERTDAMYRLYTEEDIDRINNIRSLKERLGFTLNEVKDIFDMEQDIHHIREKTDPAGQKELTEKTIESLKHQIRLLEEKEIALHRARDRYAKALDELCGKMEKEQNIK